MEKALLCWIEKVNREVNICWKPGIIHMTMWQKWCNTLNFAQFPGSNFRHMEMELPWKEKCFVRLDFSMLLQVPHNMLNQKTAAAPVSPDLIACRLKQNVKIIEELLGNLGLDNIWEVKNQMPIIRSYEKRKYKIVMIPLILVVLWFNSS